VPDQTLAEVQAQLETVAAERAELLLRIKRREVVEVAKLESGIVERAHQVRDLLMVMMPARVAPMLAADHAVEAAHLSVALMATMRRLLTAVSMGYRSPISGTK